MLNESKSMQRLLRELFKPLPKEDQDIINNEARLLAVEARRESKETIAVFDKQIEIGRQNVRQK